MKLRSKIFYWLAMVAAGVASFEVTQYAVDTRSALGNAPSRIANDTSCEIILLGRLCPAHPELRFDNTGTFLNPLAATNRDRCVERASEFFDWCKSTTPVRATFYASKAAVVTRDFSR